MDGRGREGQGGEATGVVCDRWGHEGGVPVHQGASELGMPFSLSICVV